MFGKFSLAYNLRMLMRRRKTLSGKNEKWLTILNKFKPTIIWRFWMKWSETVNVTSVKWFEGTGDQNSYTINARSGIWVKIWQRQMVWSAIAFNVDKFMCRLFNDSNSFFGCAFFSYWDSVYDFQSKLFIMTLITMCDVHVNFCSPDSWNYLLFLLEFHNIKLMHIILGVSFLN